MKLLPMTQGEPEQVLNPGDNIIRGTWASIHVLGSASLITATGYKNGVPKQFTPITIDDGISFDLEDEGFENFKQGWYIDVNIDGAIYKAIGDNPI